MILENINGVEDDNKMVDTPINENLFLLDLDDVDKELEKCNISEGQAVN